MKVIATLLCLAVFYSCKKYDEKPIIVEEQFLLEVKDTVGVKADGRSVITLFLIKKVEIKDVMRATFQTSKGTISNAEVAFFNDTAISFLNVDQDTGTYFIKAQLKEGPTVKVEKAIIFKVEKALPEFVAIDPDKLIYNFTGNKQVSMSIFLSRAIGLVSKGCTVDFKAYQLGPSNKDTISVGRFTGLNNNFSGQDGKLASSVVFYSESPNDVDSFKVVHIKAFTKNNANKEVSAQLTLNYLR